MATEIYTAQNLIDDLSKHDPNTPVIAQSCCFDDNSAAGGIQLCSVHISEDGVVVPMPDDEANGIAIEVINAEA